MVPICRQTFHLPTRQQRRFKDFFNVKGLMVKDVFILRPSKLIDFSTEFGIHSLRARTGDWRYRRVNQVNHATHSSLAFNISKPSVSQWSLYDLTLQRERACGTADSPATSGWSLTSVGRLISNRSSRLAFQWLMMSASFLLSSSLLPDMVDNLSDPLCPSVLLNKSSRNVSPQEEETPPQKAKVQVCCLIARTSCGPSLCSPTDLLSVWSVSASRSRCASARSRCTLDCCLCTRKTVNCLWSNKCDSGALINRVRIRDFR